MIIFIMDHVAHNVNVNMKRFWRIVIALMSCTLFARPFVGAINRPHQFIDNNIQFSSSSVSQSRYELPHKLEARDHLSHEETAFAKQHDNERLNDVHLKQLIANTEQRCLTDLNIEGPHYRAVAQLIKVIVSDSDTNQHHQAIKRKKEKEKKTKKEEDEQLFVMNNNCDSTGASNSQSSQFNDNNTNNNDKRNQTAKIHLAAIIGHELVEFGARVHECLCSMIGSTMSHGGRQLISLTDSIRQRRSEHNTIAKWLPTGDCTTENCMQEKEKRQQEQEQLSRTRKRRNIINNNNNQNHHQSGFSDDSDASMNVASLTELVDCIDSVGTLEYELNAGLTLLNNKCRMQQQRQHQHQDSLVDLGEAIARHFARLIHAEPAAQSTTSRGSTETEVASNYSHFHDTHTVSNMNNSNSYNQVPTGIRNNQAELNSEQTSQVLNDLLRNSKSYGDYPYTETLQHLREHTNTDTNDTGDSDKHRIQTVSKLRNSKDDAELWLEQENTHTPSSYLLTNSDKRHSSVSSTSGTQHPMMVSSVMDLLRAKVMAEARRKPSPLDETIVSEPISQTNLIELFAGAGDQTIEATYHDNNREKNRRPNSDNNNLLMVIG